MEENISVLIPTKNRKYSLLKTIDSIKQQSFAKNIDEIVIADDSDEVITKEEINFNNANVKIFTGHKNIANARNVLFENAKNNFCFVIEDDITISSDVLEKLYLDLVFCNSITKNIVSVEAFGKFYLYLLKKKNNAKFIFYPFFSMCSLVLKDEIKNIKYDEDLRVWEDIIFGTQMRERKLFTVIDTDLCFFTKLYENGIYTKKEFDFVKNNDRKLTRLMIMKDKIKNINERYGKYIKITKNGTIRNDKEVIAENKQFLKEQVKGYENIFNF